MKLRKLWQAVILAAESFAIPGLLALAPWPVARRVLWLLSACPAWYREEVTLATAGAVKWGAVEDGAAFARRHRFRLLVDNLDGFLTQLRGPRYLDKWVRASGDPLPGSGPVLFVGNHHGCGFWFLPFLRARGLPLNIIAPKLPPLRRLDLRSVYGHMRHRMIANAAGRALVYRGSAAATLRELFDAGEVGFGLADIPTNRDDAVKVQLLGRAVRLPQGMFELANDKGVPVFLFWADTDLDTGVRRIFAQDVTSLPLERQVQEFGKLLDGCLKRDPAGWRFWPIADQFFSEDAAHVPRTA